MSQPPGAPAPQKFTLKLKLPSNATPSSSAQPDDAHAAAGQQPKLPIKLKLKLPASSQQQAAGAQHAPWPSPRGAATAPARKRQRQGGATPQLHPQQQQQQQPRKIKLKHPAGTAALPVVSPPVPHHAPPPHNHAAPLPVVRFSLGASAPHAHHALPPPQHLQQQLHAPQRKRPHAGAAPGDGGGAARHKRPRDFRFSIAELPPRAHSQRLLAHAAADEEDEEAAAAEAAAADARGGAGPADPQPLPPIMQIDIEGATAPATREALLGALGRVHRKDVQGIFHAPVTEDVAPGYFGAIAQPMDLSTARAKVEAGQYSSWAGLVADLRLMFSNALTYNPRDSVVWQYSATLAAQAGRIMQAAAHGKVDARSAAGATRKQNAAVKAAERAKREKARQQERAQQRAAQEAKVLRQAGVGSAWDDDENVRQTYRKPIPEPGISRWRALGGGATAEGTPLGAGRLVLRPPAASLQPRALAASVARFAARLRGRARELALARAAVMLQGKHVPAPAPPKPESRAKAPAAAAPAAPRVQVPAPAPAPAAPVVVNPALAAFYLQQQQVAWAAHWAAIAAAGKEGAAAGAPAAAAAAAAGAAKQFASMQAGGHGVQLVPLAGAAAMPMWTPALLAQFQAHQAAAMHQAAAAAAAAAQQQPQQAAQPPPPPK